MKRIIISIALVCLCGVSARASYDPGAAMNPGGTDPTFTLYDDHTPPAGAPGTYVNNGTSETYILNLDLIDPGLLVNDGDVVLLENGSSQSRANWSDVLNFSANTIATLTSYDGANAAAFWATYNLAPVVVYIQETGGQYTVYAPNGPPGVEPNIYNIDSVVPEPTTMLAGALLLLPLGMSALRILRKNRIA